MLSDLIDNDLFGNEAGEDEDVEILSSYFCDKPEFDSFYSTKQKLHFVRSKKGVGKSALLVQTMYRRQQEIPDDIYIYLKAADLIAMQDVKSDSPSDLIHGWQQRICSRINLELGSRLRLAFSDDTITLIESAEVTGFRGRNLIGSLIDRMKVKGVGLELDRKPLVQSDSEALLRRVSEKKDVTVWLFIDDIDGTFINSEHERLKTSTFFSACRYLVNSVKGLHVRASVRTDVWTILAQFDEALDKCEQYMLDLKWSTTESGRILQRKICSYFTRSYPKENRICCLDPNTDGHKIFGLVFKEPFSWGGRMVEAFQPIHILSAGRPRWAAQLCKLAGKAAYSYGTPLISMQHISSQLKVYGQARLDDLYREHRHQCPSMENMIEAFAGSTTRYTTHELLQHITEKLIVSRGLPKIDGVHAPSGSIGVAHFLYRMGFICARDDQAKEGLGFVRFEDRPNLLSSTVNLDDGLAWEIHPSYRDVLKIKN